MTTLLTIAEAISFLRSGKSKIIAAPTESVYGLSVDPHDEAALQALLALKRRDPTKGLILVASHVDALMEWIEPLTDAMKARILPTWPGPCTWIVPAKQHVSPLLRGRHETLAVRVTSHPVMKALCDAAGTALVSTSANHEGEPSARSVTSLIDIFGAACPPIVDGPLGDLTSPTPIYDALTGNVVRS